MNLNQTQFNNLNVNNPTPLATGFHGTKADISGSLKPSSETGAEAAGISLTDKTYFTPLEEEAWGYATGTGRGSGRPRVYQTRPMGKQELDTNHSFDRPTVGIGKNLERPQYTEMTAPRTAPSQEITDTKWIPTPKHRGGWVQGTLPHVNWHQFDAPNWVQFDSEGVAYDDFDQRMDTSTPIAVTPDEPVKGFKDTPLPGFEPAQPQPKPSTAMPL